VNRPYLSLNLDVYALTGIKVICLELSVLDKYVQKSWFLLVADQPLCEANNMNKPNPNQPKIVGKLSEKDAGIVAKMQAFAQIIIAVGIFVSMVLAVIKYSI
jgi:hypothetical protein